MGGASITSFNYSNIMYFKNGNFMYFTPPNTIDANRTIKLPDASGTVALEDKTENWVYPGTTSSYSQLSSDVNISLGGNVSPNNVSYLPADPYTGQEVYVKGFGTTVSVHTDPSTNYNIESIIYDGFGGYNSGSVQVGAWSEAKFIFREHPSPSWDYCPIERIRTLTLVKDTLSTFVEYSNTIYQTGTATPVVGAYPQVSNLKVGDYDSGDNYRHIMFERTDVGIYKVKVIWKNITTDENKLAIMFGDGSIRVTNTSIVDYGVNGREKNWEFKSYSPLGVLSDDIITGYSHFSIKLYN